MRDLGGIYACVDGGCGGKARLCEDQACGPHASGRTTLSPFWERVFSATTWILCRSMDEKTGWGCRCQEVVGRCSLMGEGDQEDFNREALRAPPPQLSQDEGIRKTSLLPTRRIIIQGI